MAHRHRAILLEFILSRCSRNVYTLHCKRNTSVTVNIIRVLLQKRNKSEEIKMKILRQSRLNRYYALCTDKNSSFERQLLRELCDPNRIYDAKPIEMAPIKAVRL
jgi:hypothetical protein